MKRIVFKKEFHDAIKAGTKTATIRKNGQGKPLEGEVFAAVEGMFTKAENAFAKLRCTRRWIGIFKNVTDEMLERTNAGPDWYYKNSGMDDYSIVTYIEFEVVE